MTILIPFYKFSNTEKMQVNNISVSEVESEKTTVEFLMKWDGTNGSMPFGFSSSYGLFFSENGYFGFTTGQNDIYGIESTNLINKWVHICAIFNNGDITQNKIYINGVEQSLTSILYEDNTLHEERYVDSTFFLSGWNESEDFSFNGELSNLRIWRNERNQEQITSTPFDLDSISDSTLLGFWRLDGDMIDESDYRNNGTSLTGFYYQQTFITDAYLESLLPEGKWIANSENWRYDSNNQFSMIKNTTTHSYLIKNEIYKNFTIESSFYMPSDDGGIGFTFDFKDKNNYKQLVYSGGGVSGTDPIAIYDIVNGVRKKVYINNYVPYWTVKTDVYLKLQIAYDVLTFFIDGVKIFDYKLTDDHEGLVGYYSYYQLCNITNITFKEQIANRMKAKYVRYAVSDSEALTEITVQRKEDNDVSVEITPRVVRESKIDTIIDVKYAGNNEILTEIQPYISNSIETEIEVRPMNRMWALYEVKQPPIITTVIGSIKDSFVRKEAEFSTINYGSNNSMVVGRQYGDEWISFIEFDVYGFNKMNVVSDILMRIYYEGIIADGVYLSLYEADKKWEEHGITYLNKPDSLKHVTDEYVVNTTERYIEFNVTDSVNKWIQEEKVNNGFIIKLSDESYDSRVVLKTKESYLRPALLINHYDTTIYSAGRSQIITEITSMRRGISDVESEIEVVSTFGFSKVDAYIRVHRVEVPFDEDYEVEITVSKPVVGAEISVSVSDDSDILTEVEVRNNLINQLETEIITSKPLIYAEIFSAYKSNINVEILPRVPKDDDILTEISSSRNAILTELLVMQRGNNIIETEITVQREEVSEILTEIAVTRDILGSEIFVKYKNIIETEITVQREEVSELESEILISKDKVTVEVSARVSDESILYTEITATKPSIHSEIYVKYRSDILVEIEPNIKSDTLAEIIVSKPMILTEITARVFGESERETELFVPFYDDKETEINIHVFDQIEAEIKAKVINQIEAEIIVSKPAIYTEIAIWYYDDSDVIIEIEPRILMVNNLNTEITIRKHKGAYVYIL